MSSADRSAWRSCRFYLLCPQQLPDTLLVAVVAIILFMLPGTAQCADLTGTWKVTIAQHQHPAGYTVAEHRQLVTFEQFADSVSLRATRAYPEARLHSGLLRAEQVIQLSRDDVGLAEFPQFVGTQWRTHFVGWITPDGNRIDARDQNIAIVRVPIAGQQAARAVYYTIPVVMERLNVELGFVLAGTGVNEFAKRLKVGDEFRLLARFEKPVEVKQLEVVLSSGSAPVSLSLIQDNADPTRFWSERQPALTGEYLAVLGSTRAALTVDSSTAGARGFCPKFLHDAIKADYADGSPQRCSRPNLPMDLRSEGNSAATARSLVRFERQLRAQSLLTWDLPAETRIASACDSAPGRSNDEDAWIRMRTATEYLVARRRLVDGIMSGLESVATLDAMTVMQCRGESHVGVASNAKLLGAVECSQFAAVPNGVATCQRLQSQCPSTQRFSGLVDDTELAVRQSESIDTALAQLGSGAAADQQRQQLQMVQQLSATMNPWVQGEHFQRVYSAGVSSCSNATSCDSLRRNFVCEGMQAQAKATAATVKRQVERFAQALACIENAEGRCELSSSEFRQVVRSAPELRKLPPMPVAAPGDRGLIGFTEFMVEDINCRAELQVASEEQKAAIRDFAVGTTLTIATAGLGSVAARVALTASRARVAGLALEAARTAALATRLQRIGLAVDLADMSYGAISGVRQCNDVFKESSAIPPLNEGGARCPGSDRYDGPQLTEQYRSCVLRSVAFSLATAGLVALPAGVSRVMDESAFRRAAEALKLADAAQLSTAQKAALVQVFRERLAGSVGEGLEAAESILKQGGFNDDQIRSLFLKLAPDVRLLGNRLVQGLDGEVVRQVRMGEHTLTVTRVRGKNQIFACSFCRRLADMSSDGNIDAATLDGLAEVGTKLGLDQANRPEALVTVFETMVRATANAPDPSAVIAALKRVPPATLKSSAKLIGSPALATAIAGRPQRAAAIFEQLATHGDTAANLFTRLPGADTAARDLGDLIDLLSIPDTLPIVARLTQSRDPSATMTLASACARFINSAPRGNPQEWAQRMLRLAEDVATAGPAVGSERRAWATMTDVAVAQERLGSAKFADYLEAIDFFRRDGAHTPGVIRNGRARETANLQDVISGDSGNPVHNALELVGTKWLIDTKANIQILAGRSDRGALNLPALTKENVTAFGAREIRTPGTRRTIEADTAVSFLPSQVGGTSPMNIVLDWKNYEALGDLKESDLTKAIEALDSGVATNVLFLSPRSWSQATIGRIAGLNRPGLMLATLTPDATLLRFLDEPIP